MAAVDIKGDGLSAPDQGDLFDSWDEAAGNERAATLLQRGFLPEITPAFPGVTTPLPVDPLGVDGGPPPPPPWITHLRHCNVRQDFQNFLNALYAFHQQFRKPKYASTFSVMRYPMHAFLQSILAPKPPQDVLVSTFSGSMQAQIQLLILKKSGRASTAEFYRHVNTVCIALTTFINTCQAGIRQWHELEAKGITNFKPLDAAVSGQPHAVQRSLVHLEPTTELMRKIEALDSPGERASCTQITKSAFHYYPRLMITATVFLGFAVGGLLQSALLAYGAAALDSIQSSSGLDIRLLLPLTMLAIAVVIATICIVSRMRWLRLDYSNRKKEEADAARRERLSKNGIAKKFGTWRKQDRSKRLISSASDDGYDGYVEGEESASHTRASSEKRSARQQHPIDLESETRTLVAKQQAARRSTQEQAVARGYGAAAQGGGVPPTVASVAVSPLSYHESSPAPYRHAPTTTAATVSIGHAPPKVVVRSLAAQPTAAVIAPAPQQPTEVFADPFAAAPATAEEEDDDPLAVALAGGNPIATAVVDENENGGSSAAVGDAFVLPPYESAPPVSTIFNAPPPLPGDNDDSKRIGKKKKKSKTKSGYSQLE